MGVFKEGGFEEKAVGAGLGAPLPSRARGRLGAPGVGGMGVVPNPVPFFLGAV
jgi:hypothetical protein